MPLADSQFLSSDLRDLYQNGAPRAANGIPQPQQGRCVRLLDAIEAAVRPADLNLPGYGFHQTPGGLCRLTVADPNVISFRWVDGRPVDIDYS